MDHPQFIPLHMPHNASAVAGVTRYLPSYREATLPYSLRLPAYRSSYIRRYHPYPRYQTPAEQCSVEPRDEIEPLDLSILNVRIAVAPASLVNEREVIQVDNYDERANAAQEDDDVEVENRNEEEENKVEELPEDDEEPRLPVDPDVVYANFGQEESRRNTFLRIDVVSAFEALRFD